MNSELETDYKNLQESIAQTKKAFEDLFKELGKITAPEEPQVKKEKEIHIYYSLPTDTHSGLISYTGDIPKKAVQKLLKTIHDS